MTDGPDNVVTTWLDAYDTRRAAVEALNGELGTRYDLSRVGQWRRGERSIPAAARDVMLRDALPIAVARAGADAAALYELLGDPA